MNANKTYKSTITVFKQWDAKTREGVINTSLLETGVGFDLHIKYVKEDKILAFHNLDDYAQDPIAAERIQPWRLFNQLILTGKVEVKPYIPPAIQKLREAVKDEPCPPINVTPMELDVLFFGIYSNPAHNVEDPWIKGSKVIKVPSKTIKECCKTTRKASVGTVMASLTKKGLIISTGKELNRICEVTRNGALVLRREIIGA